MEEIIKKAIEGGYICTEKYCSRAVDTDAIINTHNAIEHLRVQIYAVILDPLFWQALFKDKHEEWEARTLFFGILFGDGGESKGWDSAIAYLSDLIKNS